MEKGWVAAMPDAYVTITARGKTSRLYTGATGRLEPCRRDGARLVWYEEQPTLLHAKRRGAVIRRWKRACKIATIERANPGWEDLSADRRMAAAQTDQTPR
jgi:putative endonuclease